MGVRGRRRRVADVEIERGKVEALWLCRQGEKFVRVPGEIVRVIV